MVKNITVHYCLSLHACRVYVENVFKKTFELCESGHSSREDASVHLKEPPPLSSQYTRPDKDAAISSHKSRYVYAKRKCSAL